MKDKTTDIDEFNVKVSILKRNIKTVLHQEKDVLVIAQALSDIISDLNAEQLLTRVTNSKE